MGDAMVPRRGAGQPGKRPTDGHPEMLRADLERWIDDAVLELRADAMAEEVDP